MPITLLNHESMEGFRTSMLKFIDEYYILKNSVGNTRQARIKTDINALFDAAKEAGITGVWKPYGNP